jgi:hypothetical protein
MGPAATLRGGRTQYLLGGEALDAAVAGLRVGRRYSARTGTEYAALERELDALRILRNDRAVADAAMGALRELASRGRLRGKRGHGLKRNEPDLRGRRARFASRLAAGLQSRRSTCAPPTRSSDLRNRPASGGSPGTRLAGRRDRDGVQTHRVGTAPLACRQFRPPRRAGQSRREVRERRPRRMSRRITKR